MNTHVPIDSNAKPPMNWRKVALLAALVVLGVSPWAKAQLPTPDLPAFCPPITAFAHPSFFDVIWGTTPIKFPYA